MVKKRVHTTVLVVARFLARARLSIFGVSRHRLTVCRVISFARPLGSKKIQKAVMMVLLWPRDGHALSTTSGF